MCPLLWLLWHLRQCDSLSPPPVLTAHLIIQGRLCNFLTIVHVGTNGLAREQSELTKMNFNGLLSFLSSCGKSVFISGPIPTVVRGAGRFSRSLSLHSWLQSACTALNIGLLTILTCFGGVQLSLWVMDSIPIRWVAACLWLMYSMLYNLLHVTDCWLFPLPLPPLLHLPFLCQQHQTMTHLMPLVPPCARIEM